MIATLVLGGAVHTTEAQLGGSLLIVEANPLLVQPGGLVSFRVVASGTGPYTAITVDVPSDLTISQDVTCVHSTDYCDGSSATALDADTNRLSVSAPGNDVSVPDTWPSSGYSPGIRVTVSFSINVPTYVSPGTLFEIDTHVGGLFNPLLPYDEEGRHVQTVVEILDASGRRVQLPPAPAPTSALTLPGLSDTGLMVEFGLDPEDMTPEIHLVPGEHVRFKVNQGFRDVVGFFTLTIRLPREMKIVEAPRCSVISPGCSQPFVLESTDGTTDVTVLGYNSELERASLDFTTEVSSNTIIGTSSSIIGRLAVTEALTGEAYQAEKTIPVHFTGPDTRLAMWEEEATLRVTMVSHGQEVKDAATCITLFENVRWGNNYFVCDNDSGAAIPQFLDWNWTLLSDTNPNFGEIVVSVTTGTYTVTVESVPAGFTYRPEANQNMFTVPPEGVELTIELTSP